jgi:hypothetical protein
MEVLVLVGAISADSGKLPASMRMRIAGLALGYIQDISGDAE